MIPKISRCVQDLLVSLSLNLDTATPEILAQVQASIIDTLPKKVQSFSSGLGGSQRSAITQQMHSLLWKTLQHSFQNMANCHNKLADKILTVSFNSEFEQLVNHYNHKTQASNLNQVNMSNLVFGRREVNTATNQLFAKLMLDEIWKHRQKSSSVLKELLKNCQLRFRTVNTSQLTNLNKNIVSLAKCIVEQADRYDMTHEYYYKGLRDNFICHTLDILILLIALLGNTDKLMIAGRDDDKTTLGRYFFEPAQKILEHTIQWLTEKHRPNQCNLASFLILTILQRPFFIERNIVLSDSEFHKSTGTIFYLCKKIPITGKMLTTILGNLPAERMCDILDTFTTIFNTHDISLTIENADNFAQLVTEGCYFENNFDLIIKDNYWKCAEFLLNMCEKCKELKKVVFDACYVNDDTKFEPVKQLIKVLVSNQRIPCRFDVEDHRETLERAILNHYSRGERLIFLISIPYIFYFTLNWTEQGQNMTFFKHFLTRNPGNIISTALLQSCIKSGFTAATSFTRKWFKRKPVRMLSTTRPFTVFDPILKWTMHFLIESIGLRVLFINGSSGNEQVKNSVHK